MAQARSKIVEVGVGVGARQAAYTHEGQSTQKVQSGRGEWRGSQSKLVNWLQRFGARGFVIPAQTCINGQLRSNLPRVLHKQSVELGGHRQGWYRFGEYPRSADRGTSCPPPSLLFHHRVEI